MRTGRTTTLSVQPFLYLVFSDIVFCKTMSVNHGHALVDSHMCVCWLLTKRQCADNALNISAAVQHGRPRQQRYTSRQASLSSCKFCNSQGCDIAGSTFDLPMNIANSCLRPVRSTQRSQAGVQRVVAKSSTFKLPRRATLFSFRISCISSSPSA